MTDHLKMEVKIQKFLQLHKCKFLKFTRDSDQWVHNSQECMGCPKFINLMFH